MVPQQLHHEKEQVVLFLILQIQLESLMRSCHSEVESYIIRLQLHVVRQ